MRGFLRVLGRGILCGLTALAVIVSVLGVVGLVYDIKRAHTRTDNETQTIQETQPETVKDTEKPETHAPAPYVERKSSSTSTYTAKKTISSDTVLYDSEYAKITYQGMVKDTDWIPNVGSMQVKIENKCDYEITVTFGELAVDGGSYTVHSFSGSCGANAKKTVNYRSLGEPEIPYYKSVTKLSTTITIMDANYNFIEYNYPVTIDAEADK